MSATVATAKCGWLPNKQEWVCVDEFEQGDALTYHLPSDKLSLFVNTQPLFEVSDGLVDLSGMGGPGGHKNYTYNPKIVFENGNAIAYDRENDIVEIYKNKTLQHQFGQGLIKIIKSRVKIKHLIPHQPLRSFFCCKLKRHLLDHPIQIS